jgi:hypothetical protein
MVKNALQAQLLKAGLVDNKKAKKLSKQAVHEQKTGQSIDDQIKASSRMTITAGNDEQFEIGKECWGGFGQLFGKEVAFCVIDQAKSMGNMLMDQSDNYKISFYKQGNSEPWLIVNCKKLMKQTVTGEEAKKMNPSNDGQKAYNMYVGEVIK